MTGWLCLSTLARSSSGACHHTVCVHTVERAHTHAAGRLAVSQHTPLLGASWQVQSHTMAGRREHVAACLLRQQVASELGVDDARVQRVGCKGKHGRRAGQVRWKGEQSGAGARCTQEATQLCGSSSAGADVARVPSSRHSWTTGGCGMGPQQQAWQPPAAHPCSWRPAVAAAPAHT